MWGGSFLCMTLLPFPTGERLCRTPTSGWQGRVHAGRQVHEHDHVNLLHVKPYLRCSQL
jgi:hypothetical protein